MAVNQSIKSSSGDADVADVDVISSALPSGASTSAAQATLLTELQAKADLTETQPVNIQNTPLDIAKGNISGHASFKRFGLAPDFDTGDNAVDVWDGANDGGADLMTYTFSSSADIDRLSSSEGADTEDIKITGLDTNWDEVIQTITLTGQTPVALTTDLIRVNRMQNVGSADLVGTIYCFVNVATTSGVPNTLANTRSIITIGNGQTTQSIYSVPNNKTAYMFSFYAATEGAKKSTNFAMKLLSRPFGTVFTVDEVHALIDTGTSHFNHRYTVPTPYAAKTDLKWTAQITEASITDASVGAGYELIIVDD